MGTGIRQALGLPETFSRFESQRGSQVVKNKMKDEPDQSGFLREAAMGNMLQGKENWILLSRVNLFSLSILNGGQLENMRER